eukprot:720708-Lingulodinium_polyedra.AAC.1
MLELIRRARSEAVNLEGPDVGEHALAAVDWSGARLVVPAPLGVEMPRVRTRVHGKQPPRGPERAGP